MEVHYYKYLAAVQSITVSVPFYCSLCHFIGNTERKVLRHTKDYRPHKLAEENLILQGKKVEDILNYVHKIGSSPSDCSICKEVDLGGEPADLDEESKEMQWVWKYDSQWKSRGPSRCSGTRPLDNHPRNVEERWAIFRRFHCQSMWTMRRNLTFSKRFSNKKESTNL